MAEMVLPVMGKFSRARSGVHAPVGVGRDVPVAEQVVFERNAVVVVTEVMAVLRSVVRG